MEMRAKAGGVQHSQGENRMEQNNNEKGRDYEMETRLRKLLGRMSYNEKVIFLARLKDGPSTPESLYDFLESMKSIGQKTHR